MFIFPFFFLFISCHGKMFNFTPSSQSPESPHHPRLLVLHPVTVHSDIQTPGFVFLWMPPLQPHWGAESSTPRARTPVLPLVLPEPPGGAAVSDREDEAPSFDLRSSPSLPSAYFPISLLPTSSDTFNIVTIMANF